MAAFLCSKGTVAITIVDDNARTHCPPPPAPTKKSKKRSSVDRWQRAPLPSKPLSPVRRTEEDDGAQVPSICRWESCAYSQDSPSSPGPLPTRRRYVTQIENGGLNQPPRRLPSFDELGRACATPTPIVLPSANQMYLQSHKRRQTRTRKKDLKPRRRKGLEGAFGQTGSVQKPRAVQVIEKALQETTLSA